MSDSELNTLPTLPRSEPTTPCSTPSEDDAKSSPSQEEMKVELRNRLTGEVVDLSPKKSEVIVETVATEIPQSMLNSLYVSNSSLEDETEENKEIDFVVESENGDQDQQEDNDDASTESDAESQSIDEEEEEEHGEEEGGEEEEEEEGEEEGDPLDDVDDTKRYVVMDEGKPIVIIVNNPRQNNETPGLLIFMMALVFGLWLFNNTCKLCTLLDDKCLFRLP